MVEDGVTIVRGEVRQVRRLAEGQKARTSKRISQYHPPSANSDNWRRGSNFPRDMQIFPHWGHHLAEGGQISEKKASPWLLRPSFGGGVAWLDCCPIRRVLDPA